MATTTVLANPQLTIDSVDYTDQCTSAVLTERYEALEKTAFGGTARVYTAGLGNHELTCTLMLAYGASEVEENLNGIVGTNVNVVVTATAGAVGVGNPSYTITGAYLESVTPINAALGELQTVDLTFTGGTIARATA